jgi:hypothetical protein
LLLASKTFVRYVSYSNLYTFCLILFFTIANKSYACRPEDPEVYIFLLRASTKKGCRFVIKRLTLKRSEWLYLRTKTLAPLLTEEELEQILHGKPEDDSERLSLLRKEFFKGKPNLTRHICFVYCVYTNTASSLGAAVMVSDEGEEQKVYKERDGYQCDLVEKLGAESFVLEDAVKRGTLLNLLVSVGMLFQHYTYEMFTLL